MLEKSGSEILSGNNISGLWGISEGRLEVMDGPLMRHDVRI
jgi:hypothetical protein